MTLPMEQRDDDDNDDDDNNARDNRLSTLGICWICGPIRLQEKTSK